MWFRIKRRTRQILRDKNTQVQEESLQLPFAWTHFTLYTKGDERNPLGYLQRFNAGEWEKKLPICGPCPRKMAHMQRRSLHLEMLKRKQLHEDFKSRQATRLSSYGWNTVRETTNVGPSGGAPTSLKQVKTRWARGAEGEFGTYQPRVTASRCVALVRLLRAKIYLLSISLGTPQYRRNNLNKTVVQLIDGFRLRILPGQQTM